MLRDQTENTPDMKALENKEIKDFNQKSIVLKVAKVEAKLESR